MVYNKCNKQSSEYKSSKKGRSSIMTPKKPATAHKKSPSGPERPIRCIPIRRRVVRHLLLRWAAVLGVGMAFLVLYGVAVPFCDLAERNAMAALSVALFAVIVWRSRVLPRTFAREWTGVVVAREAKKVMKMPRGLVTRSNITWGVACTWTVRRDPKGCPTLQPVDPKELTPESLDPDELETLTWDTEEIWEGYFAIGEPVRHYKNARYLVKAAPRPGEENLLCPLCGQLVMEPRCTRCRILF